MIDVRALICYVNLWKKHRHTKCPTCHYMYTYYKVISHSHTHLWVLAFSRRCHHNPKDTKIHSQHPPDNYDNTITQQQLSKDSQFQQDRQLLNKHVTASWINLAKARGKDDSES